MQHKKYKQYSSCIVVNVVNMYFLSRVLEPKIEVDIEQ
jgi:hypothetical protein